MPEEKTGETGKRIKAEDWDGICLGKGCRSRHIYARGLCRNCYRGLSYLLKKKGSNFSAASALGLCLSKYESRRGLWRNRFAGFVALLISYIRSI